MKGKEERFMKEKIKRFIQWLSEMNKEQSEQKFYPYKDHDHTS